MNDLVRSSRILISDLKPNAAAAADKLPRGVLSSELVRNERLNSCRAEGNLEMLRLLDVVALGDGSQNMWFIGLTRMEWTGKPRHKRGARRINESRE